MTPGTFADIRMGYSHVALLAGALVVLSGVGPLLGAQVVTGVAAWLVGAAGVALIVAVPYLVRLGMIYRVQVTPEGILLTRWLKTRVVPVSEFGYAIFATAHLRSTYTTDSRQPRPEPHLFLVRRDQSRIAHLSATFYPPAALEQVARAVRPTTVIRQQTLPHDLQARFGLKLTRYESNPLLIGFIVAGVIVGLVPVVVVLAYALTN